MQVSWELILTSRSQKKPFDTTAQGWTASEGENNESHPPSLIVVVKMPVWKKWIQHQTKGSFFRAAIPWWWRKSPFQCRVKICGIVKFGFCWPPRIFHSIYVWPPRITKCVKAAVCRCNHAKPMPKNSLIRISRSVCYSWQSCEINLGQLCRYQAILAVERQFRFPLMGLLLKCEWWSACEAVEENLIISSFWPDKLATSCRSGLLFWSDLFWSDRY